MKEPFTMQGGNVGSDCLEVRSSVGPLVKFQTKVPHLHVSGTYSLCVTAEMD